MGEDEIKQEFYEALQAELQKDPKQNLTILMGNFNAKVGSENAGYERVMGRHGCGSMNENREYFTEFCGNNNLVIRGTLFQHQEIYKLTWVSPRGRYKKPC